jgi:peptidoglycan hydrolase CwlO-like protein
MKSLYEKVQKNEEELKRLRDKRENLDRQIKNLETKLINQKFALAHPSKKKKETTEETEIVTKEVSDSSEEELTTSSN